MPVRSRGGAEARRLSRLGRASVQSPGHAEQALRAPRAATALRVSAPPREPRPLRVFASSREQTFFFGAAQ